MVERDRLAAVLAVGVLVVPVLRHRARPVERDHGGDVFERGRARASAAARASARLRAGTRRSCRPGAAGRRSSGRRAARRRCRAASPVDALDEVERDLHHVEVAQAEEVHLQQAEVFDAVHLVLRDHRRVLDRRAGLGLALDRQVLGERLAGDHDRGRVDAVLAAQALEARARRRRRAARRDRRRRARAARPPSCSRRRTSSFGSRHACSGVSRPMMSGGISLAILSPTTYG